jgi:signal peptidase I
VQAAATLAGLPAASGPGVGGASAVGHARLPAAGEADQLDHVAVGVEDCRRPHCVRASARGAGQGNGTGANRCHGGSAVMPRRVDGGQQKRSAWREYAESLIVAVLLALAIRAFVVQAFVIPSGSMLPTLRVGDYLLVNKLVYLFRPIRRGDIIVFKFPQDETRDFIKRVVGLPGETLEIRGEQVLIDGQILREPYAVYTESSSFGSAAPYHLGPIAIPPGHLFMMGDNRDNSLDSRSWGLLDESKVVGEASIIYFSVRSAAIPYDAILPRIVYAVTHPSLTRWSRIGRLVR